MADGTLGRGAHEGDRVLLTEPHAWAGSTGFIMRWDDRIGSWVVRIDNLGQQVAAFDNWKAV